MGRWTDVVYTDEGKQLILDTFQKKKYSPSNLCPEEKYKPIDLCQELFPDIASDLIPNAVYKIQCVLGFIRSW